MRAMASSSVPFEVGGLVELLVDDYAKFGSPRGARVRILKIIDGGPIAGGSSIKVALATAGVEAYLDGQDLRALPAPAALLDPPPQRLRVSMPPEMQQPGPAVQEPLLYFLTKPSRLICLRLEKSAELGQWACNVVEEMLHIIGQRKDDDIKRDDKYVDESQILQQLHSEGIWRSETYSALASIRMPGSDGSMLSAVGLASNKQTRTRAVYLSVATALALELLKGSSPSLVSSTCQVMQHFPVLESLVKEAQQLKQRADRPDPEVVLPPPPWCD